MTENKFDFEGLVAHIADFFKNLLDLLRQMLAFADEFGGEEETTAGE